MKFKFSYEKLLEYHKQQEEIARRDYIESVNHLDTEKSKYQKMWDDHDQSIAEEHRLRMNPAGVLLPKIEMLDIFVKGQKVRIANQRLVVMNHTQIVEQKQEILIQVVKECKTFEKLKEKQLAEFKKMQKKKEAKNNDELVVTRFKRNAA